MGDTQTAPAGSQISSQDSDIALYQTFDSFPWSKTGALIDTLGGVQNLAPKDTHVGTSIFCRGVFYQRQTGNRVDITRYIAFVSGNPSYPSVDARLVGTIYETRTSLGGELEASPNATLRLAKAVAALPQLDPFDGYDGTAVLRDRPAAPAWQHSAPLAELRIKRDGADALQASDGTGDAPSSERFAAVAAAIQSGQPLEGVRQIPDKVEQPPGVTPIGKRTVPRKPWEKNAGDAIGSTEMSFDSYVPLGESFPKAEDRAEGSQLPEV